MKNIEIVVAINNLNEFIERQRAAGQSLLSVTGQFAIKHNLNMLNEQCKPYIETLDELMKKYNIDNPEELDDINAVSEDGEKELNELLDIEVDIDIRKIKEIDFKDGATIDDILLLEFMTE